MVCRRPRKKVTKTRIKATVLSNLAPLSKAEISKIFLDASLTAMKAELCALLKGSTIQRTESGRVSNSSKA